MSRQEFQGHGPSHNSSRYAVAALVAVFLIYAALAAMGKPQSWTQSLLEYKNRTADTSEITEEPTALVSTVDDPTEPAESQPIDDNAKENDAPVVPPPIFMIIPFVGLLLCIAILPLIPATEHWWERNSNRFLVAVSFGVVTLLYYLFFHDSPVRAKWLGGISEPAASGPNFHLAWTVFENAFFYEYIPFIVILFTLYTIAGGIRIAGNLKAKPLVNTIILAIGGTLASFIGTTGAAMLLIRLLLETNKLRRHKVHTVVFFIFIVCNCGGLLTPLGDPPLFLGYLRGVNFWFPLLYLWGPWLLVNGLLLVTYFLWDTFIAYPHESQEDIARDECAPHSLKITGYMPNVLLLFGVILAVLFLDPSKTIFGWHPWMYFREMVMLGLVFLSLTLGCKEARAANTFCYAAITEVAALFFGIFICMQAPLQILHVYGPDLGIETPMQYFWISGTLAMWLDNAPTYVVFFETACTFPLAPEAAAAAQSICGVPICVDFLIAVSLASVFMGAMTYIGNGPNFMVKAIAENSGVKMPSFFGFMGYSCLVVLPILIVMSWFFLR